MQDRYVGDLGDYGKYALLRALSERRDNESTGSLGVVWCLFPNESHNSDGRHISYLRSGHLRELDPNLHDALREIVDEKDRSVSAVARSEILPADTIYFEDLMVRHINDGQMPPPADRVKYRQEWLSQCLKATRDCELLFFDPDNGIETRSVDKRHTKAGKYIFWDELIPFFERGQSLVVYHHLNRTAKVQAQVEELSEKFREMFPAAENIIPLIYRRGSCRVFWLVVARPMTKPMINRIDGFLKNGWRCHFDVPAILRT